MKVKKTHTVSGRIDNPYLREFHEPRHGIARYAARDALVSKYSWAIPNQDALDTLIELSPIVEMGAGTGYWASLVTKGGGEIVAFDEYPPGSSEGKNHWHPQPYQWFDVQKGGPDVVAQYADHTLFLCWPPYAKSFAADVLKRYMQAGGQRLVYVGESQYGCTGDDEFFILLDQFWNVDTFVHIPEWDGMHDGMTVYSLKEKIGSIYPLLGPRKADADLWDMVVDFQGEPPAWKYVLTKQDVKRAQELYAEAVNFAMQNDLPISSCRVEVGACLSPENQRRFGVFLNFNGTAWQCSYKRAPQLLTPRPGSFGRAAIELATDDVSKEQIKALGLKKVRNEDKYRRVVTIF